MRQPDYRTSNRQMGFVPGMKPPTPGRTVQQNGATRMGLGQPAGNAGRPAPPMAPTAPMGGGAPAPAGPPPAPQGPPPSLYPPPAPTGPEQAERALWTNRYSKPPLQVLAEASMLRNQSADPSALQQLLSRQSLDEALLAILGPESVIGQAVLPPSTGRVRAAILGA